MPRRPPAKSRTRPVVDQSITTDAADAMLAEIVDTVMKYHHNAVDVQTAVRITTSIQGLAAALASRTEFPATSPRVEPLPDDEDASVGGEPPPESSTQRRASRKRRRTSGEDVGRDSPPPTRQAMSESAPAPATQATAVVTATSTATPPPSQSSTALLPTRKRRGTLVKQRAAETAAAATTFAISSECGPAQLHEIRAAFRADLLDLGADRPLGKQRTVHDEPGTFTMPDADELTGYFFDEVMGPHTLQRLVDIVQAYIPPGNEEEEFVDFGAAERSRILSMDTTAPATIRRLFGFFGVHQHTVQAANPIISHLQQVIHSRELLLHYDRVRDLIEDDDAEMLQFLRSKGLKATVGRGWSSVVIDYLADTVGVQRRTFINICERAKGINQLVEQFGEGILPILPPGALHKLRRYGNHRMEPVYELLKKHVASFQPVCDIVKEFLYDPVLSGERILNIDAAKLTQHQGNTTLIDIVTAATTPSGADNDSQAD